MRAGKRRRLPSTACFSSTCNYNRAGLARIPSSSWATADLAEAKYTTHQASRYSRHYGWYDLADPCKKQQSVLKGSGYHPATSAPGTARSYQKGQQQLGFSRCIAAGFRTLRGSGGTLVPGLPQTASLLQQLAPAAVLPVSLLPRKARTAGSWKAPASFWRITVPSGVLVPVD